MTAPPIPHALQAYCKPAGTAAPNTPQWLEERRSGIGASDVGKILGLSEYGGAKDVWLAKKGEAPDDPPWLEPYRKVGHLIEEPFLRHIYADLPVEPVLGRNLPTLQSIHHPLLRASLDGYDPLANMVEEIKTDSWDDKAGVPDCHWVQAQQQMIVTGAEAVYIRHITLPMDRVILPPTIERFIADSDLADYLDFLIEHSKIVSHRVDPDEDWQSRWIERSEQWWSWYVVEDREPPEQDELDGTADLSESEEVLKALHTYAIADKTYKEKAKVVEERRDAAKDAARAAISRYARLDADGPKRVTIGPHKATACRTRGGGYYWRIYPGDVGFDFSEF
jgi:hypothetical protein